MKKQVSKKSGFTLIELMVVVIIVGILAAVAIPMMSANKRKSVGSEAVAALGTLNTANKLYKVATGAYATDVASLVSGGYIESDDLDGTYFTYANYSSATWSTDNDKYTISGQSDKNGETHTISWDTDSHSYKDL
jgi:prepilin-type N-terminal cleavage/methylation domain-containing protein